MEGPHHGDEWDDKQSVGCDDRHSWHSTWRSSSFYRAGWQEKATKTQKELMRERTRSVKFHSIKESIVLRRRGWSTEENDRWVKDDEDWNRLLGLPVRRWLTTFSSEFPWNSESESRYYVWIVNDWSESDVSKTRLFFQKDQQQNLILKVGNRDKGEIWGKNKDVVGS